jgi:hypothetical protein
LKKSFIVFIQANKHEGFTILETSESDNSNLEPQVKQGNVDNPYQENIYDLSNTFDSAYTDSTTKPNPKNYSNFKAKKKSQMEL